jgi:hypothetical protein
VKSGPNSGETVTSNLGIGRFPILDELVPKLRVKTKSSFGFEDFASGRGSQERQTMFGRTTFEHFACADRLQYER